MNKSRLKTASICIALAVGITPALAACGSASHPRTGTSHPRTGTIVSANYDKGGTKTETKKVNGKKKKSTKYEGSECEVTISANGKNYEWDVPDMNEAQCRALQPGQTWTAPNNAEQD